MLFHDCKHDCIFTLYGNIRYGFPPENLEQSPKLRFIPLLSYSWQKCNFKAKILLRNVLRYLYYTSKSSFLPYYWKHNRVIYCMSTPKNSRKRTKQKKKTLKRLSEEMTMYRKKTDCHFSIINGLPACRFLARSFQLKREMLQKIKCKSLLN